MQLLEALASADPGSVRTLAKATGATPASTHRLLLSMKAAGMIVNDRSGGGYRLTPRVLTLGLMVPLYQRLQEHAPLVLRALTSKLSLPAALSLRDDTNVLYLLSSSPVGRRPPSRPGDVRAMHSTASGKVLLAHSSADVVQAVVSGGLASRTAQTITTASRLSDELETVRIAGLATDRGEDRANLAAVAVPIYGPDGEVEASLALCGPLSSAVLDRPARHALLRGADEIMRSLRAFDHRS